MGSSASGYFEVQVHFQELAYAVAEVVDTCFDRARCISRARTADLVEQVAEFGGVLLQMFQHVALPCCWRLRDEQ